MYQSGLMHGLERDYYRLYKHQCGVSLQQTRLTPLVRSRGKRYEYIRQPWTIAVHKTDTVRQPGAPVNIHQVPRETDLTRPQRGSFPLDHEGECKKVMQSYLSCMKRVRGVNEDECRELAKGYLTCRMDKNLMARDDFKNLGFAEKPKEPEKGVKGELHW